MAVYERKEPPKESFYGRKPLPENERKKHHYTFRLNNAQEIEFRKRYTASRAKSITEFTLASIFNRRLKVVVTDEKKHRYVKRLEELHRQFRVLGVDYNSLVRSLNANFTEKKALWTLNKLEQITAELTEITKQMLELTFRFREEE